MKPRGCYYRLNFSFNTPWEDGYPTTKLIFLIPQVCSVLFSSQLPKFWSFLDVPGNIRDRQTSLTTLGFSVHQPTCAAWGLSFAQQSLDMRSSCTLVQKYCWELSLYLQEVQNFAWFSDPAPNVSPLCKGTLWQDSHTKMAPNILAWGHGLSEVRRTMSSFLQPI